jgi:hypothetical protein
MGTGSVYLNFSALRSPEADKIIAQFRAAEIRVIHGAIVCRAIPSAATNSPEGTIGFIARSLGDIAAHVVETEFVCFLV